MARFVIKESEIRNYVRGLIKEALDLEGKTKPEEIQRWLSMSPEDLQGWQSTSSRDNQSDIDNRKKMLMGQAYNRGMFGDKSKDIERAYREKMGFPPIVSVKGKPVLDIDELGNDITAANTDDAIAARKERARRDHADKMARRFIRKQDRVDPNQSIDKFANDVESDPYTQKWLAMSPEEREAEAERIRQERNRQSSERNAEFRKSASDIVGRGIKYPTKEELEDRIKMLIAKRDALEDNDLNRYDREMYDYIINDTQDIINKYHKGIDTGNANDAVDGMIKTAKADIDNDSRYKDMGVEEFGDSYVDSSEVDTNNGTQPSEPEPEVDDYEPLDDVVRGKKTNKRDFDDAREMGMFGDDDEFVF